MADIPIVDLLPNVMALCRGVPEPLAIAEYRRAAREFCTESMAWRPTQVTITRTGAGVYDVTTFTDAEVFDAVYLTHDDLPLTSASQEQISARGRQLDSGTPQFYRCSVGQVVVAPPPDAALDPVGRFVARPTRSATVVESELIDRFDEVIEHGALMRLMMQPNKAWTDMAGADVYNSLFREELEKQRGLAANDGQRNVPRTVRYGGL